jgi:hypothetical protein
MKGPNMSLKQRIERAEALRNEMKKAKDERRDAAMVVNDVMEGWLFTTPRGRS